MKNLIFCLFVFISCAGMEELMVPLPPPCEIGYFETSETSFRFVKTMDVDTIHVLWQHHEYGIIPVTWIDGEIDWSCIGFSTDHDLFITIMTAQDTCVFNFNKLH